MAKIILASTSPRRSELLRRAGLEKFKIIDPDVEESWDDNMPPEDLVTYWSRKKAESMAEQAGPEDLIIAADTIVWCDSNILGKPTDQADAFRMLTLLSGSWHSVYTGVTVMRGADALTEHEETSVLIRNLTAEQIEAYIETGEPMDKAGAYGIQERGALLCERIDGDFYNVMGLPLYRLSRMLEKFDLPLLG